MCGARWQTLLSASIGFDVVLMGNFNAYPSFQRKFGVEQPDGTYQIPAPWQAGMGNGSSVGSVIGLLVSLPRLQTETLLILLS